MTLALILSKGAVRSFKMATLGLSIPAFSKWVVDARKCRIFLCMTVVRWRDSSLEDAGVCKMECRDFPGWLQLADQVVIMCLAWIYRLCAKDFLALLLKDFLEETVNKISVFFASSKSTADSIIWTPNKSSKVAASPRSSKMSCSGSLMVGATASSYSNSSWCALMTCRDGMRMEGFVNTGVVEGIHVKVGVLVSKNSVKELHLIVTFHYEIVERMQMRRLFQTKSFFRGDQLKDFGDGAEIPSSGSVVRHLFVVILTMLIALNESGVTIARFTYR